MMKAIRRLCRLLHRLRTRHYGWHRTRKHTTMVFVDGEVWMKPDLLLRPLVTVMAFVYLLVSQFEPFLQV